MEVSMRLDYRTSSLVVVGGWNPNILNEEWIRRNLLDHHNEQLNMSVSGNITPSTVIYMSLTEAVFRNVKLTIAADRLELTLVNTNNYAYIEDCIRRLCNCQPNTLIVGYGVNFSYLDSNVVPDNLRGIFGQSRITQRSRTENHACQIDLGGLITNINVDIDNLDNRSGLRFNFHFNVNDLSALISHISKYPLNSLKEKAVEFAFREFGLRLEN